MTANVAQAIVTDSDWNDTLGAAHRVLRPGGRLVFETRDPAARAWLEWVPERSFAAAEVDGIGRVESVHELVSVELPLVRFRTTTTFVATDEAIPSDSTLRFRDRPEVEADLRRHGFVVDDVRDAPDRPGREFVFVARRPTSGAQDEPGTTTPDS